MMRPSCRALGSLLLMAGCTPPSARPCGRCVTEHPWAPPTVRSGTVDAIAILGDMPARASQLGASAPAVVVAGAATENDWAGAFVDVPKGACLLVYARGATSIDDVDVLVYSDDGAVLAADEARDARPTVLLCPQLPQRVYAAVHTVAGEGFVALGAQLASLDRSHAIARALGAKGLVADDIQTDSGAEDPEAYVRAHRVRLGGVWDEMRRQELALDARAPTIMALPLETGACVDALVLSSNVGGPLDIEAFDALGRIVARAHEGWGARSLTVCASFATDGTLRLRPHVGGGPATVVLSRARPQHLEDFQSRPEIAWIGAAYPLDAARAKRDETLAVEGYSPPATTKTGVLSLERRVTISLRLGAVRGGCDRVDVIAGMPLAWVDAHLWDDGRLLSSASASSSLVLFACAGDAASLELEALGRSGPFAVTVRGERWLDPAFGALPLAASRLLQYEVGGAEGIPRKRWAPVRRIALDSARMVAWGETVAPAQCVRVVVAVQGEGAGLDLQALDAQDETELDRAESAEAASVRACAPSEAERRVRFQVRASAGRLDALVVETNGADGI